MTYCTSCGAGLRPEVKFCERCGRSVDKATSSRLRRGLVGGVLVLGLALGGWSFWNQDAPRTDAVEPSRVTRPETQSESFTRPETGPDSEPESAPQTQASRSSVTTTPQRATEPELVVDDIPGIESVPMNEASTYMPVPRSRYRLFRTYPDGDKGVLERVVAPQEGSDLLVMELAESSFFPDDPPTVTVSRWKLKSDGLYRSVEGQPFELYLPNDLSKGRTWKTAQGRYRVVEFDTRLVVEGKTFLGALAVRYQNDPVGVEETIWIAPGHGEVFRRYGDKGEVNTKLLSSESMEADELSRMVSKYAGR